MIYTEIILNRILYKFDKEKDDCQYRYDNHKGDIYRLYVKLRNVKEEIYLIERLIEIEKDKGI